MSMIKGICEVLDVQKKGTKEEVITRLLEFLMKPEDSGRKVPQPKKRKSELLCTSFCACLQQNSMAYKKPKCAYE